MLSGHLMYAPKMRARQVRAYDITRGTYDYGHDCLAMHQNHKHTPHNVFYQVLSWYDVARWVQGAPNMRASSKGI